MKIRAVYTPDFTFSDHLLSGNINKRGEKRGPVVTICTRVIRFIHIDGKFLNTIRKRRHPQISGRSFECNRAHLFECRAYAKGQAIPTRRTRLASPDPESWDQPGCAGSLHFRLCVRVCRQLSTYFLSVGSKPLGHCEIKGLEKFLRSRLLYFFSMSSPAQVRFAGRRRRSGHWRVLGSRGGSTFTMFASNDTQAAKRPK